MINKGIVWTFTVEKSPGEEILGKNDQEYQKMSEKTIARSTITLEELHTYQGLKQH